MQPLKGSCGALPRTKILSANLRAFSQAQSGSCTRSTTATVGRTGLALDAEGAGVAPVISEVAAAAVRADVTRSAESRPRSCRKNPAISKAAAINTIDNIG